MLFYRPYASRADFQRVLLDRHERTHELQQLHPDTDYLLRMKSFNSAGESVFSEDAVGRTLSFSDTPVRAVDPAFPGKEGMHGQGSTELPPTAYPPPRLSTGSSSRLLYMVLGIVLGVMMLILVIVMVMCAWKQRQQRRMMGRW